jgi:type IV secretory pathway VirJ component
LRSKRILLWLLIAALAAALSYGTYLHRPRTVVSDQFGPVTVFPPLLRERGVVYVLSGSEGWTRADQWTAWNYAMRDNYVVAIDTPRLLDWLNQHAKGCVFFPGLFEDFSRVQERTVGTPHDYEPIVLGRGVGATLAYLGQVGAPVLAIGAAVILDPEPAVPLHAARVREPRHTDRRWPAAAARRRARTECAGAPVVVAERQRRNARACRQIDWRTRSCERATRSHAARDLCGGAGRYRGRTAA